MDSNGGNDEVSVQVNGYRNAEGFRTSSSFEPHGDFECAEAVRGLVRNEGLLYVHARVSLRFGFLVRDLLQVFAQRSHFLSSMLHAVLALRLREPKIQKSKTCLRPETFGFLGFPRVFLVFPQKSKKNHSVFGFPTEIQKTQVFFVFHQRPNQKTKKIQGCFGFPPKIPKAQVFWFFTRDRTRKPKIPVFFCFPPKIHKSHVIFLDFCWKTKKTPGKPNKNESFGPLRKILDFCFFGFPRRNV